MCQSVFKNMEEKKRKEEFTRLFVAVISNSVKNAVNPVNEKKRA